MSKMSGKQKVVEGFDLNAFVGEAEGEPDDSHVKPQARPAPRPVPQRQAPKEEPRQERVQVMITKAEMATLQKKAGLVPVSKWLHHELKERRII